VSSRTHRSIWAVVIDGAMRVPTCASVAAAARPARRKREASDAEWMMTAIVSRRT
jgi:hypothetical protein